MEDSTTYQAIIRKGEVRGLQKLIHRLGRKSFGVPSKAVQDTIASITSVRRLERLTERLFVVNSWEELLV